MPPTPPPQMPHKSTPPYHHLLPPPPQMTHPHHNPSSGFSSYRKDQGLLKPHHRTNPMIWCGAILGVIFSIILILAGIITLIIFLVIKPRSPVFEITQASLNGVYIDSPSYFNGDLTFFANFTNPNTKMDLVFEYLSIELYYHDTLISAQGIQPFFARRQGSSFKAVHMISSEVYLPSKTAMEIQKEARSNKIMYTVIGTFKVRANFGFGHLSYWIYGRCSIEMAAPPGGILVARSCKTKK